MTPEEIVQLLRDLEPDVDCVQASLGGLGPAEPWDEGWPSDDLYATFDLFHGPDPDGMVNQKVPLVGAAHRADSTRVRAYLTAWVRSLPGLYRWRTRVWPDQVSVRDVTFPEALDVPDAHTADDFARLFADRAWLVRWDDGRLRPEAASTFLTSLADFTDLEHYEAGLVGGALAELARPVIGLSPGIGPDVVGRLGGDPDLPEDHPWPTADGVSLPLVVQLDLAALRPYDPDAFLPTGNVLQVFADPDRRHVALHCHRAGTPLRPTPAPPDCAVGDRTPLVAERVLALPPTHLTPAWTPLETALREAEFSEADLREHLRDHVEAPTTFLGGWPVDTGWTALARIDDRTVEIPTSDLADGRFDRARLA